MSKPIDPIDKRPICQDCGERLKGCTPSQYHRLRMAYGGALCEDCAPANHWRHMLADLADR